MPDQLEAAVLTVVDRHAETGVTMGKIVDRLVADGASEQAVELAIWRLIQDRRLTPHGFVCRKVRKPTQAGNGNGAGTETRAYEFVLIPWSPALDAQLELDLEQRADERADDHADKHADKHATHGVGANSRR